MKNPGAAPIVTPATPEKRKTPGLKTSDIRDAQKLVQHTLDILDADGVAAPSTREVLAGLLKEVKNFDEHPIKAKRGLEKLRDIAVRVRAGHAEKSGKTPGEIKDRIEPVRGELHEDLERERNRLAFEELMEGLSDTRDWLEQNKRDALASGNQKEVGTVREAEEALKQAYEEEAAHGGANGRDSFFDIEEDEKRKQQQAFSDETLKMNGSNIDELKAKYEEDLKKQTLKKETGPTTATSTPLTEEERLAEAWEKSVSTPSDETITFKKSSVVDQAPTQIQEKAPTAQEQAEAEAALAQLSAQEKQKQQQNETLEKMRRFEEDVRARAEARRLTLDQSIAEQVPQHKHWFKRTAEAYQNLSRLQKFAIGSTLLVAGGVSIVALGPTAPTTWLIWGLRRGLVGLGTYAWADTATAKMQSRRKAALISGGAAVIAGFGVPAMYQYFESSFGGKALEKLGFNTESVPSFKLSGMGTSPQSVITSQLFDQSVTVTDTDRARGLWGILESKLAAAHIIDDSMSPQRKNYILDFLEKKLQSLGPEELKKLGFSSGNINLIRAGEKLDLSILEKQGWLQSVR